MKEYWFYGIVHDKTVFEENLSEKQKDIIKIEKEKINKHNYKNNWLGCLINDSWVFKRHGFEVIKIEDHRGNIARKKLHTVLDQKFIF